MVLLKVQNITKKFGDFYANKDISLEINKGTIHSIIGENGAGKSTLMNIIAGVLDPSSGSLELNGKIQSFKNPNDATSAGIGMVQQEFMLFNELSIAENIIAGFEDLKLGRFIDLKTSYKKITALCQEYNFELPLSQSVGSVPLAVQQQVEIVKVLYKKADIIILDEPTSILTPQGIRGLFRAMRFLVEQGKTIIFITHKLKEVLEVSDVISVLKNGEHVGTFQNENITEEMLSRAMVGRDVILDITRQNSKTQDEVMLSVEHLNVRNSRGVDKVKDVSFKVNRGEIVGVVGIANNGQSELVNAITGMESYQSGSIKYQNHPLKSDSPRTNRLSKIGYVPQDRNSVGSALLASASENIIIGKHLTSFTNHLGVFDWKMATEFAKQVQEKYRVKVQDLNDAVSSLSGGNLQKLIVGREFSQDNKLVIVEDPVRGIDIGSIEFVWNELVNQVEKNDVSVLLVTYDLNEAMTLSNRILVMFEGQIVARFDRDQFDQNRIGLAMLGGKNSEVDVF